MIVTRAWDRMKGLRIGARWNWHRVVLRGQLMVLLAGAILLTIMPVELLNALAAATAAVRDFAVAYRPVVAFIGLLLVGGFAWSSLVLMRATPRASKGWREPRDEARQELPRAA